MKAPHKTAESFDYQRDCRDKDMPLTAHLAELRSCLLKSIASLLAGTACSYAFMDVILSLLTAPAENLYYMRPAEAFVIYLKIAVTGGFVLASPVILYQAYNFIRPALTLRESVAVLYSLPLVLLLGISGMVFSYTFVFPRSLDFFLSFAQGKLSPMLSIESYLSFMLMLVVPFAIIFNIPVLILLLGKLQLVTAAGLKHFRKHIILAAFILAAFITPTPDIITQVLLALPMVILYELSITILNFIMKGQHTYEQT